jgi:hypothetical protein
MFEFKALTYPGTYAVDTLDDLGHKLDDEFNELKDKAADQIETGLKKAGHTVVEIGKTAGEAVGGAVGSGLSSLFSTAFGDSGLLWVALGLGAFFLLSGDDKTTHVISEPTKTEDEKISPEPDQKVEPEQSPKVPPDDFLKEVWKSRQ